MHERWINIETIQSSQGSIGRTTVPIPCPPHNTVWWVVALTLVLSGCASGLPQQAYYREYHANDQTYRYYKTADQKVLLVSPDGQVAEATDFVGSYGYPATRKDGQLVWSRYGYSTFVCSACGTPDTALPVVGTTTWQAEVEDWDMTDFRIAPETGGCRAWRGFWLMYKLPREQQSCWHLLWEVPVWAGADVVMTILAGAYSLLTANHRGNALFGYGPV